MVAPDDVPRRRNGLSAPYSLPQIMSWLFLAATAVQYGLFVIPLMSFIPTVVLAVFFYFLIALVMYFGMRAIAIDSMDKYLKKSLCEHRNGAIKKESEFINQIYAFYNGTADSIKNESLPVGEETKQCWICDIQVAEHSMHCKYCNKCVSHFDHHCLWLNTCIGEKNYHDFYNVMWAISAMQIVHLGISVGLVVDIFLEGTSNELAQSWFGVPAEATVLIVFCVFDICSLILLAQLIFFHIQLQREHLTTYQYIVRDSQERREKSKLVFDLQQQRVAELRRARQDGNRWYAFRLRCGGECRQQGCGICDPLEMPQPVASDRNVGFASVLGGAPINETDESPMADSADSNILHPGENLSGDEDSGHHNGGGVANSNGISHGRHEANHNHDSHVVEVQEVVVDGIEENLK